MGKMIIGIDIGGTNVKIGLLNLEGDIVSKWEINTNKENKGKSIVDEIWTFISHNLSEMIVQNKIIGIGVGAPGFVNESTGKVYEAVNIGWTNFPLAKMLQEKAGLPVLVENDANIAALGEYWKGNRDRVDSLIIITLGTGVGGGIISDGEVLHGENGTAGEIGHIIVEPNGYPCNCGRKGCLDTIASATGIVRRAKDIISQDEMSALAKLYYSNNDKIDAKDIFDLAKKGDADCVEIITEIADSIGIALANAAAIVNPSTIIVGGGLSEAGEWFLDQIKLSFKKYSLTRIGDETRIELAKLGNDAGIIGAAYLVKKNLNRMKK